MIAPPAVRLSGRLRTTALFPLVVAALVGGAPAVGADEPGEKGEAKKLTLGEIIDRSAQSVVQITCLSGTGVEVGSGSGFVIDARGWVATNYHVLRGAGKAVVQFRNGKKYDVKGLRAIDRDADVAILELDRPPAKLTAMPLGPKTPPRQGQDVIAIGHPEGLSFTVTTGIVSAVRKGSQLPKEIAEGLSGAETVWVQTSAAISRGNSGGPLLDGQGRVVGINTWVAGGQNLGFAVHIGHALALLEKPSKDLLPLGLPKYARDVDDPLAALDPRVEEIANDFNSALRAFTLAVNAAADEKAARKIVETQNPGAKYARRFFELADTDRKTTAAVQSLMLACRLDKESKDRTWLKKALARLAEDHAADKWIYHALIPVFQTGDPTAADFFRKVVANNPNRQARGLGSYLLAAQLHTTDAKSEAEAVRLLENCSKEYRDVTVEGTGLPQLAQLLLYQIRNLSVGKTAPDISGADADGKAFKLGDYRGKVVLLDFFADWCPHCERMYPHERRLVQEYAARPFALLGVNCDKGKDTLKQLQANKTVTWRCWWDGTDSRISQGWQVEGFPALYLLDHNGVIRQIYSGQPDEKELDAAVKRWVDQVPKK